ncbi:rhodanese-like domain-containing protein [Bacillaceae bacterium S4-13-58]
MFNDEHVGRRKFSLGEILMGTYMILLACLGIITISLFNRMIIHGRIREVDASVIESGSYCVIDIRDYISVSNSPYPSAENIPLSYLPRVLNSSFPCEKDIVIISDDQRGVRLAAKYLAKKKRGQIYYIKVA